MNRENCCNIKPKKLTCEYMENPTSIDASAPRFSWQFIGTGRDLYQSAYRIKVASNLDLLVNGIADQWDSGVVMTKACTHIQYNGLALVSGKKYYWSVECWDNRVQLSSHSDIASFEMGLLNQSDWTAQWIGGEEQFSAPLFRKPFFVPKEFNNAKVYISGLGYYELYINGQRIGDHVLDPNWTDYDTRNLRDLLYPFDDQTSKRVTYVTYDVTNQLSEGDNVIGIMLGNGWYNQTERTVEGKLWYDLPKLIFQMDYELNDGQTGRIISDTTWKVSGGPIIKNNIFYGEVYDSRLEKDGWNTPLFNDSDWASAKIVAAPAGKLCSQLAPPDRKISTIHPINYYPLSDTYIFDMGINISGWVRLHVAGPSGVQIQLRFSEELKADGSLDFESCGGVDQIQCDIYITRGVGNEAYEPRFTWHAFRYVEIKGYPGILNIDSIVGVIVHTDVAVNSSFKCSNPLINSVHQAYIRTQLNNLHGGVPSDCPHRERLGYTGDGQIASEAAILNFEMTTFYTKWLRDIHDAQNKISGYVPHTVPFFGGGGGPAWGSICVILPWRMYEYYGDIRVLEESYNSMVHWISYLDSRTDTNGIIIREEFNEYELGGMSFIGEWCVPVSQENHNITDNMISPSLVSTFYYAICSKLVAKISKVLALEDEAKYFENKYINTCKAFNRRFFNEEKGYYGNGNKGSDVFALALNCVPNDRREAVVKNLLDNILVKNKGHIDTGIFGTPLLFDVLTDLGHDDVAYSILNQKDYPGYGYMIEKGSTTLWEFWEYDNGSHDHPMFGSVSAWFYKYLAGILVDEQGYGFERFNIKPRLLDDIDFVQAQLGTIRGKIIVECNRESHAILLKVTIPVNTSANVYVPIVELNNAVITENGQCIWSNNEFVCGVEGIHSATKQNDSICFNVSSGIYTFVSR